MNTLQTLREFAFTTVLAAAALVAPATQAADECLRDAAAIATSHNAVASLGQMVITAPRVANLGVLVVTAKRETNAMVANLGAMTVSASRDAFTVVADLGTMTVSAPSQGAVIIAGRATSRSWD